MPVKLGWLRKMPFGLVLAGTIVVALTILSYRSVVASRESDRWVLHTHTVIERLDALLTIMLDIETGYRGFALTGDDQRLETYHAALPRIANEMETIRTLTADNPAQQRRAAVLKRLVEQ